MLDVFVAAEGEAEVVMFSGGEPTIHKDILAMIDLAQGKAIRNVNLNTNGIRLATDKRFVAALGERNGRGGKAVNIYLQFDGFAERTHLAIRGKDLRERKRAALDNCAEVGLTVTLVAAVEQDLNSDELGAIIQYGIAHPAVRSVAFQPVTHSGRHVEFDPMTRLTNSDIIHGIADQLPEWFRPSDFVPVPCCFPTCRSITYLIVDSDPATGETTVVPIPRLIQIEDYLDYVSNRVIPEDGVRAALEKLWSASAFMGTKTTAEQLTLTAAQLECAACGLGPAARREGHQPEDLHDCDPGLPGPVHAQRPHPDEVLRRGDHPGRAADPVLRLQLRGLPRTGPGADVRRGGRGRRTQRHPHPAAARTLALRFPHRRRQWQLGQG